MNFKVGHFTTPTATGSQGITGVGFLPKVVLIFGTRVTSYDANTTHTLAGVGIGISSSERCVTSLFCFDNNNNRDVYTSDARVISQIDDAGGTQYAADLTSLDSDGFTLNWSTVQATAYKMWYVAIGGDDIEVNLTSTTVASGQTTKTVPHGLSGTPDLVMALAAPDVSANGAAVGHGLSVGFYDRTTQRCMSTCGQNGNDGSITSALMNNICHFYVPNTTTVKMSMSVTSVDATNIELSATPPATTTRVFFLGIKGGRWKIGDDTKPTSAQSKATTGVGFRPEGVMLFHHATITTIPGSLTGGSYLLYGAYDGTTQAGQCQSENVNDGSSGVSNVNVFNYTPDAVTVKAAATSLDSDGFTLNYSIADSGAEKLFYLAAADAPVTFPAQTLVV